MISNLTLSQDVFNTPDICTKMKIMHAVDKSLDRVTISEICEKAGISRQTFYRHFKSKYDIPWWFSIFCCQFYLNEIGRTIDCVRGITITFALSPRNAIFSANQSSTASTRHLARPSCRKIAKLCCWKRCNRTDTFPLIIICNSLLKLSRNLNARC